LSQGVAAFYDSRDARSCVGWCQWPAKGGEFGTLEGYSTGAYPRSIPVHRPRFSSNVTAKLNSFSIIFRASSLPNYDKTNVFMHLGGSTGGGSSCSLSQVRDTIFFCNQSLVTSVSLEDQPAFDLAFVSSGNNVASLFFNGIFESAILVNTSSNVTASGLFLGRSGDGNIESSLDGSLVYLIILNRAVSGAEVQNLIQWSDNVHTLGAARHHFAIGWWNSFSFTTLNQQAQNIIWRIPMSARPAFSRTLSFLLRLPDKASSSRNLLLFSASGAFTSRRFGIDWIYNSTRNSQLFIYDAIDSLNHSGSKCSISGSGAMKIDAIATLASGSGSAFFIYVNHVLQTSCSFNTSWRSAFYAGDVLTRQSNGFELGQDAQFQHVHVLSYAASHYEVTRPQLLSIVVSNASLGSSGLTTATVNGCCFTTGLPCSLLSSGLTVSVSCAILSAVEASVELFPNVQVVAAALTHDGQVFVLDEIEPSDSL
jgi:hypothetical protein